MTPENVQENNLIVGYFKPNPDGLKMDFIIRNPVDQITNYTDRRLIRKGISCYNLSKNKINTVYKQLGLSGIDQTNKFKCEKIKIELIKREIQERKKKSSDKKKWFYLHFEKQPDIID